ncbi:Transmembrane protein [Entamoeba marina]
MTSTQLSDNDIKQDTVEPQQITDNKQQSLNTPHILVGIATTVIAMIHLQELFIVVGGFYSGSIMNIALNARLIGSFMLVVLSFIAYFKQLKACFMLMTGYSLTFCSMFVHENSFVLILLNNTAFDIFSVIGNIIWFVFFIIAIWLFSKPSWLRLSNLSLCMYEFFVVFIQLFPFTKQLALIRYIGVLINGFIVISHNIVMLWVFYPSFRNYGIKTKSD